MPDNPPWWRRPGVRLRHDMHLWIRRDAARFVRPGFDPADVFPTLARKARPAPAPNIDDELAAEIEAERRALDAIHAALAEVNAEMARRRALDTKYSPTQPRIPAGNPRGGQWTDRSGAQNGQGIVQDAGQGTAASLAQPMGTVDVGDLRGSSELGDLFRITPQDAGVRGVQLAGNESQDDPARIRDPVPEIPLTRPATSAERTDFLASAADWLKRHPGLAGDIYSGAINAVSWLRDYHDVIQASRDAPKSLEELQQAVNEPKPGYDIHHIVEQTPAERFGFTRSEIDHPENLVRIPRLQHYQINGWYGTASHEFDRLSPRAYLEDKDWDERYRVGLQALKRFKVLK
jgi:hypothetical protein